MTTQTKQSPVVGLTTKPKFGVVASIAETSTLRFFRAMPQARNAHAVEIRLDTLRHCFSTFERTLEDCLMGEFYGGMPVILTLRPKNQGGSENINSSEQLQFWQGLPGLVKKMIQDPTSTVYVDWGYDLFFHVRQQDPESLPFPWSKVGCSLHDFEETPDDLEDRLQMIEETPALAFLKLVTKVTNPEADIPRIRELFALHKELDPSDRPLIAFGMGPLGQETRRQCLGWGSSATFGFLAGHLPSAPGQLSVGELMRDPSVQAAMNA